MVLKGYSYPLKLNYTRGGWNKVSKYAEERDTL